VGEIEFEKSERFAAKQAGERKLTAAHDCDGDAGESRFKRMRPIFEGHAFFKNHDCAHKHYKCHQGRGGAGQKADGDQKASEGLDGCDEDAPKERSKVDAESGRPVCPDGGEKGFAASKLEVSVGEEGQSRGEAEEKIADVG